MYHSDQPNPDRERDEFVQRMLEKEDGKTKKLGGGLTAEQIRELATTGAVSKDVRTGSGSIEIYVCVCV